MGIGLDMGRMAKDAAETQNIGALLTRLGAGLDEFLKFEHPDALHPRHAWRQRLDMAVPREGIGIQRVLDELVEHVIPGGSAVPRPGFCSFITTGGASAATLASTAASVASPQRYGLTAFNFLEELSLRPHSRKSAPAQHHARERAAGDSSLLHRRAHRVVTRASPGRGRSAHRR